MKKKTKIILFGAVFLVVFLGSALLRIMYLGSIPSRIIQVEWNDSVGRVYRDIPYENDHGFCFDLYVPTQIDPAKAQYLILFIHGGSFNSGAKEDGESWCKYYAAMGYLTASVDYSLQKHGYEAPLSKMNTEIRSAVAAIDTFSQSLGIRLTGMASCGVSAGGTLALDLAYSAESPIPVRFVMALAAPTCFDAAEWSLLKKVDGIKSDHAFYQMMLGDGYNPDALQQEIDAVSPAAQVREGSVPTLIGYGLKDHCVPATQRQYLIEALNRHHVPYDYVEFPNSNHGLYNDPDQLRTFLDLSKAYCSRYFK